MSAVDRNWMEPEEQETADKILVLEAEKLAMENWCERLIVEKQQLAEANNKLEQRIKLLENTILALRKPQK